ncbi:alpha/beta-hydrolase [Basidiobolus meristosporus CBS 931.73]|uniref:Alpha/beta-hydrolase n=1 Tax=Basidiobolus meristosporus CBS 931.73 TaxID=1314790 RepID=A0A1Y1Z3M9_9FUNG|nr:alpha/beta-hydrolase [Basidiobolus meristosporus CBS 931.73]|eukprot:ORY04714.1 alpha/beta-hydrolase [Basidiobolus meristosporus CBS 931.73]
MDTVRQLFFNTFTVVVEPLLFQLSSYQPSDLTYGRSVVPYNEHELKLHCKDYIHEEHKIDFKSEYINPNVTSFIYYQTIQSTKVTPRNTDIVLVHGLHEYGGRLLEFAHGYLEHGFRLVVLDLPGFGRSSGLPGYFTNTRVFSEAVHTVVQDLKARNTGAERKLFVCGGSLGGYVSLRYALDHPEGLTAIAVQAPLIYVSPESRPPKVVEYIGQLVLPILGRLPIVEGNKGKNSSDPRVDEEFENDPMGYHGNVRVASGLSMLSGIEALRQDLEKLNVPFLAQHGDHDRATNYHGSIELMEKAKLPDSKKKLIIYKGCEHDMFRDAQGPDVLRDLMDWLVERDNESN